MKKSLLFIVMVCAMTAHAQVVNIPDANFKNALLSTYGESVSFSNLQGTFLMQIDANNDGEIQQSEALQVGGITIFDIGINSVVGLEAFTNLKELRISNSGLQSIDLSALVNLEILVLLSNELTSLNVQDLINLEEIYCDDNLISTPIDFSNLAALRVIYLNNNFIPSINLYNCNSLATLFILNNELTEIELGYKPNLSDLRCGNNQIQNLDFSRCPQIMSIDCGGNEITHLNLKNGSINLFSGFVVGSLNEVYLCIDEGEEDIFQNLTNLTYSQAGLPIPNLIMNSYCTFTPGGDFNTINGLVNNNYLNEGCEVGNDYARFQKFSVNDGEAISTVYGNYYGEYNIYTQMGTFTIAPQFENDWFTANPATATLNFDVVDNSVATQNFCITPNGVHNDAEVAIVPVGGAQPGFDAYYKVVYSNRGNQVLTGEVTFNFNDGVLDFVESSEPVSLTEGQLVWSYNNLLPFETRAINVTFNANSPMEIPSVNIGDQLEYGVTITPVEADETPFNNVFGLKQEFTGAYDPNDITCLEGAYVNPDQIGEYLHYNVNFENTGNASATFVVVKDSIDASKYDISSLEVLYASHGMETRLTGNKLEFIFDNIGLAANGGKGNVLFKIKSLNTLQTGDDVMQKADIYFDYNWPIETNQAVTIFDIMGTGTITKDATVTLYPNPASDVINVTAQNTIQTVNLYDVQGRLLQTELLNNTQATIDLSQRAAGIYFVKVFTNGGVKVEKVVKE